MSKRHPKTGLSPEDAALWARVTETVTPMQAGRQNRALSDTATPSSRSKAGSSAQPDTASGRQRLAAPFARQPSPPDRPLPGNLSAPATDTRVGQRPLPGVDARTRRRLARGRRPIDRTLDLHGLTQVAAHRLLVSTVTRAVADGQRTLLVITGKGGQRFSQTDPRPAAFRRRADFGPEGGGVLRRMVPLWLSDAPLKAHVSSVSAAAPGHGGDGALYVLLKRQREKGGS
ncbi:Smr/MutS family protein [Eilatimonas milleporae]|uniref:DNA-nicking Smr family endonuclease n=1 Tax=Eilatimonas milleporae TaxID=911205 RepID=A0A3M0C0D5_9PROT|nr:Smr/MutS family protein [Eilatimonas milleporae]RMB01800.1 DNA-nicking Smr family endonuclease [Eilatimonas milleporae]